MRLNYAIKKLIFTYKVQSFNLNLPLWVREQVKEQSKDNNMASAAPQTLLEEFSFFNILNSKKMQITDVVEKRSRKLRTR